MNLSKSFKRSFRKKSRYYRINFNITAPTLRLLDEKGKQIGVFSKDEALRRARNQGVDLVEIAPFAHPPVCKIIDFKKFKYLESKKERETRKKAKNTTIKQIMLSPFIGEHDFFTKLNFAKEFLKDGHRLKVIVKFRGRELGKKEFGFEVVNKLINNLSDIATIDRPPHFEGQILVTQLVPSTKKGSRINETENKKIHQQTLQNNQVGENSAKTSV